MNISRSMYLFYPENPTPTILWLKLIFAIGRLDDAIANFKKALEIKPDFYGSSSMFSLGYIYALKEDYPEAVRWQDKYIEGAPSPGLKQNGYFWRGFYSAWLGGLEKSLGFLQRAEDLAEATGNKRQVGTYQQAQVLDLL